MQNAINTNGVMIARTPTGIAIALASAPPVVDGPIDIEIEYYGRLCVQRTLDPENDFPFRDYYGKDVDHLKLVIRVKDGDTVLAELNGAGNDVLPFMVRQGPQRHITENYVSIPPALTITDEVGAVWTLGFVRAISELSPKGEFAFNVLRDGVSIGEIASRIERRNNQVRIFTRQGWKNVGGLHARRL